MFGYIKPVADELLVREYAYYRAVYCGVCNAMQRHTGRLSALTLSYDAVFYALLRMLLSGERSEAHRFHCCVHPCKARACLAENPSLVFTARAFAVLAYGKAQDECRDRRGLARPAVRLAAAVLRRAARRADLPALQSEMERELDALAALEAAKCPSLDRVADCSGRMLGAFFAEGLPADAGALAYPVGFYLGRFVAALDAAEDFARDCRQNTYNPYRYSGSGTFDAGERQAAYTALRVELVALEGALLALPLDAHSETANILKNILYIGLPAKLRFLAPEREGDTVHEKSV